MRYMKLVVVSLLAAIGGCTSPEELEFELDDMAEAVEDDSSGTEPELTDEDEFRITGPSSGVAYRRGLLRLDTPSRLGACSAFMVAPNMVVTAAHCIENNITTTPQVWQDMKHAEIRLRMVYKPSATEVMCLNETCRDASNNSDYTTVRVFWPNTYQGTGDWESDIAVITRLSGGPFAARAADVGESVRSLNSSDYMQILGVAMPPSSRGDGVVADIRGYGWSSNTTRNPAFPREGGVLVHDWDQHDLHARFEDTSLSGGDAICKGDSGGPISYSIGIQPSAEYAAGINVATQIADDNDRCSDPGATMTFTRLSSKIWMMDRIGGWAGTGACQRRSSTLLPAPGSYFRCW